jgi:hypothetical protein
MIISIIKNIVILIISSGIMGWNVNLTVKEAHALNILDLLLITISGVIMTVSLIKLKESFLKKRKNQN